MNELPRSKLSARIAVILSALLFLQVCLAILLFQTLYHGKEAEPPGEVLSFLDAYLYNEQTERSVFEQLFNTEIDQTISDFEEVFKLWVPGASHYEYESVSNSFVIVRCYSEDNELVAPPLGFWFDFKSSTRTIEEYKVAGLQPFSRLDSEYSTLWQGLYGFD